MAKFSLPHFAKPLGAVQVVPVPVNQRCYLCEEEYKFKKQFDMYIISTEKDAEYTKSILWKCKCGYTKREVFKTVEEAAYFYHYAFKKGWVLHDDSIYKGNSRKVTIAIGGHQYGKRTK